MMKFKNIFYLLLMFAVITVGSFAMNGCDKREADISDPEEESVLNATIGEVIVSPPTINVYVPTPDSVVSANIEILVVDDAGKVLADVPTKFITNLGTIVYDNNTTGNDGKVRAQLFNYAGNETFSSGTAEVTIKCEAGNVITKTAKINFINEIPENSILKVKIDPKFLNANSEQSADVTATLKDDKNRAIGNVTIHFSANIGVLNTPLTGVKTDANGTATTTYRPLVDDEEIPDDPIPVVITAEYNESISAKDSLMMLPPSNQFLKLLLYPDKNTVKAAQNEEVTLIAILTDNSGVAIPNANIKFSTNVGVITKSPVITDESGQAPTRFKDAFSLSNAPNEPVTATIIAQYGSVATGTTITIIPPSGMLPKGTIDIQAAPTVMYANHDEEVEITVYVRDSLNVGIPDVTVNLYTNVGELEEYELTTGSNGKVMTIFYDGFTDESIPDDQVIATITAVSAWASDNVQVRINPPPGENTILLSASPVWIYADNGVTKSTITANLFDVFGESVYNKSVKFTSDIGMVVSPAWTDTFGVATTLFSDQMTVSPDSVLVATIVGEWEEKDVKDTVHVEIRPAEPPIPANITLTISSKEVQVAGTGGQETALVTARVFDQFGNLIGDGHKVTFRILSGPNGGENLNNQGLNVEIPTSNGRSIATFYSGVASGTVKLRATTENGLSATITGITINSGPAHTVSVAYETASDGGEQIGGGLWQIEVSATVVDVYNNPVPDSTAVHFSLWPDSIGASIIGGAYTYNEVEGGPTKQHGVAFTLLNYPTPAIFSQMIIYAQSDTVVGSSDSSGFFPIQDPSIEVIAQPGNIVLEDDDDSGWFKVTALLKDGYGHPVNGGYLIFSTTHGTFYMDDEFPYNDQSTDGYTGESPPPDPDDQGLPTAGRVRRYLRVYGNEFGFYAECTISVALFPSDIDPGEVKVYLNQLDNEP